MYYYLSHVGQDISGSECCDRSTPWNPGEWSLGSSHIDMGELDGVSGIQSMFIQSGSHNQKSSGRHVASFSFAGWKGISLSQVLVLCHGNGTVEVVVLKIENHDVEEII